MFFPVEPETIIPTNVGIMDSGRTFRNATCAMRLEKQISMKEP